jgi:hypothetical protein
MAAEPLQPGDRVVSMQYAGVCVVVAVRPADLVEIRTPDGRVVRVAGASLRRLPPADA